jgi:hypothetical protein
MKLTPTSSSGDSEEECQLGGEMQKGGVCEWLKGKTRANPKNFTEVP